MKAYCADCGKERTIAIAMPVTPCPDCDSTAIRYPADADAAPATFRADVTVTPQEPSAASQGDGCRCPTCGTQHTPGVSVTVTTGQDDDTVPFIGGVPKVPRQYGDEEGDEVDQHVNIQDRDTGNTPTEKTIKTTIPRDLYHKLHSRKLLTGETLSEQVSDALMAWFEDDDTLPEGAEQDG